MRKNGRIIYRYLEDWCGEKWSLDEFTIVVQNALANREDRVVGGYPLTVVVLENDLGLVAGLRFGHHGEKRPVFAHFREILDVFFAIQEDDQVFDLFFRQLRVLIVVEKDILANRLVGIISGHQFKNLVSALHQRVRLENEARAFELAVEARGQLLELVEDKPFLHDQVAKQFAV